MKKTFYKDTFREIKNTLSRFIAIVAIIALGTAFFVGIKTTCPDMKITADKYYKEKNFMDYKIVSTAGFTEEDIDTIKNTSGVKGIMPAYAYDAITKFNDKDKVIHIDSIPTENASQSNKSFINRPEIIQGRLPEKSGECVIEKNKITMVLFKIGDTIKLSSGDGNSITDTLKTDEYTVVGIINSPMYISKDRGTTTIGNGQVSAFMQIPEEDFKLQYYNRAYVTADIDSSIQAYSNDYDNKIASIKNTLDNMASRQADARYQNIKNDAQKAYDDKKKEYDDSVNKANKELAEAEDKINIAQKEIDSGKAELEKSSAELESSVADGEKQISDGKALLASAKADYEEKLKEFNSQKQAAIAAGVYEMQKAKFDKIEAQLNETKQQLDSEEADLEKKAQQLNMMKTNGEAQIKDKQAELDKSQSELNKSKADYEKNRQDTVKKLSDAKNQLDSAKKQINNIPEVHWYVLGRNTNPGYVDYDNAADRMDAIAQVFPVIFILVAILICFTSMSRMVEEQRTFMGISKALGYSKITIASKFLLYALFASIIGGIIGLAAGFTILPRILFSAYSILYTLPRFTLIFDVPFAAISMLVGILVTCGSALAVCLGELNSNAAALMRPRAPKAGKVIFLEKIKFIWNRLKFTQKVTARNLIRYKSRFFMTVIGIGGCTALLLVGFGLRDAIKTIGDKQFGEIYTYQMTLNLKDKTSDEDIENVENNIKKQSIYSSMEKFYYKSIDIGYKNTEKSCSLAVPENASKVNNFINLRVRGTNKKVELSDDGIVVTEKLANMIGAKVGDEIYIKDGENNKLQVKITGICENYLLHYVYMPPSLYQKLYKARPDYNQINVKLKDTKASAQEDISEKLLYLKGVAQVNFISDNISRFNDTIKSIYNIVIVLIVSAGILSFIVLYTLTSININERIREIATIKVLGFYDKEVSKYVFRENIILTIIGVAAGLVLGNPLAHYVTGTAEVEIVMFGRQIYPISYVLSAVLTLFFAWFVNTIMIRKLKDINMVEALKTIE